MTFSRLRSSRLICTPCWYTSCLAASNIRRRMSAAGSRGRCRLRAPPYDLSLPATLFASALILLDRVTHLRHDVHVSTRDTDTMFVLSRVTVVAWAVLA